MLCVPCVAFSCLLLPCQELGPIVQSEKPVKALKVLLAARVALSRFQLRLVDAERGELSDDDPFAPESLSPSLQVVVLDLQSSEAANEEFISACAKDLVSDVERMLQTPQDASGVTALHSAAENGHLDVVRMLLEAGSEVDAARPDGFTALLVAAQHGHLEVARALLDAGADLNARDQYGGGALLLAAMSAHLDVVRTLLEAGCNVDAATDNGTTALDMAVQNGHLDVVRTLLEAGSNCDAGTESGATALHLAAQSGHVDLARCLLQARCSFNATTDDGTTPLHLAAQNGFAELVRILLEAGSHHDAATPDNGVTAMAHPWQCHKSFGTSMAMPVQMKLLESLDSWMMKSSLHFANRYEFIVLNNKRT